MKDKRGDDCNEWKGMSDLKGVSSSVRNDVNWETTTLLTETSSSRCRSSAAINASTCTQTGRYKQTDTKLRYQHIHLYTDRQIQNSVINTSTCHTHTQALKYFNYYRPASLALYKTLVVSQAQTHERQAAYHVSTVTGHLSQSPQDSSLQALLSMTSQFSCRAREVTCHYWHVNRFCYLLTYLLIYLYRQTDRYKQTDRYI